MFLAGCAAPLQKPAHTCPGKKTTGEAIEALAAQWAKRTPVKAAGQCLLKYHAEDKQHQENFPVKLWVNPPDEIYLQGDVAFDATGLVLGANADEFWCWLRPKEISTYWWGKWAQAGNWEDFAISPETMLEAFGNINLEGGDWSLNRDAGFDVLLKCNKDGVVLKKVYIETCDYVAAKIEYLDSQGRVVAGAEFSAYKQVADGFFVPGRIRVFAVDNDGNEDSARITLNSVEPAKLTSQQKQRLFVRPRPKGFNRVYEIIDGAAVEQKQQ
jgi:hypothetical protein